MSRFAGLRRLVVKLGTNVLTAGDRIDPAYLTDIARQVRHAREQGLEVAIVSSGAIGLGARELGLSGRVQDVVLRQACAAIGQPILMQLYREAFAQQEISAAQVLITREALDDRSSYVRLRNAVERLLDLGVVPIFNENDSVATAEIGTAFGDNDQLSALIASKVDAGLLLLLSDVDGYYDRDPRRESSARRHKTVEQVTPDMIEAAGKPGSALGTGGMATKLKAVRIAAEGGCRVVLAHGRERDVIARVLAGEALGTLFASRRRLRNRSRWLLHSAPRGRIVVDEGAIAAMQKHNSLLPTGILAVEGNFEAGEVVLVNERAKLVSAFSSRELGALIGRHSSEIAGILGGADERRVIARPEDTVFLDED